MDDGSHFLASLEAVKKDEETTVGTRLLGGTTEAEEHAPLLRHFHFAHNQMQDDAPHTHGRLVPDVQHGLANPQDDRQHLRLD